MHADDHNLDRAAADAPTMLGKRLNAEFSGMPEGNWRPVTRLWRLAMAERTALVPLFLYALVAGICALSIPLAVQALITTVSMGTLLQPLVVLSAVLFAVLIGAGVLRLLEVRVVEGVQRRLFVRSALGMTTRLAGAAAEEAESRDLRELANRFFDTVTLQKTSASLLLSGTTLAVEAAIGALVIAFYHPVLLAFDALLLLLLVTGVVVLGRGAIQTALEESSRKYAVAAHVEAVAADLAKGGINRSPADVLHEADRRVSAWLGARDKHFSKVFSQLGFLLALHAIASASLLGVGGWLVMRGEMTLGQLVAAELIVSVMVGSLVKLAKLLESFYDAASSAEKMSMVFDVPQQPGAEDEWAKQAVPKTLRAHGRAPPTTGRVAKSLGLALLATVVALALLPWQQTASGGGSVIAFSPTDRAQAVTAAVSGRVVKWHVVEGQRVKEGDLLVELGDNDPLYRMRLKKQHDATERVLKTANAAVAATEEQVEALVRSRKLAAEAADAKIEMAKSKALAATQEIMAAKAKLRAAQTQAKRLRQLADGGLSSRRDRELADMQLADARASKLKATAGKQFAEGEVLGAKAGRARLLADLEARINKERSSLQKARAEAAKAESELLKIETALARLEQLVVRAPRDGMVVRVVARQTGEFVKTGQQLAVIVPESAKRAVAAWVDGNDASLIREGRRVRLQFEGWPAVQFSGWPSVAVGTFGGEVSFVDATADESGRFRVVVVPDDEGWPADRFLRQGVRANAWVLLDEVKLGYEVWRRLNGFPPTVNDGEGVASPRSDKGKKAKKNGVRGSK